MTTEKSTFKKLYRSETDRVVAGVAGGLGVYFEIDPTLIRLFFVILTLFGGVGLPVYLVMWVVLPTKSAMSANAKGDDYIKENTKEIQAKAKTLIGSSSESPSYNPFGLILVLIGVYFLLTNFGWLEWLDFGKLWPVILMVLGVVALKRS